MVAKNAAFVDQLLLFKHQGMLLAEMQQSFLVHKLRVLVPRRHQSCLCIRCD